MVHRGGGRLPDRRPLLHDRGNPSIRVDLEEVRLSGVARADVELHALTRRAEFCKNGLGNARGGHGGVIKREVHRLIVSFRINEYIQI